MWIIDVMTPSLVTARPETSIAEARALMGERGIRHLPILDGTKLLGITCVCDLEKGNAGASIASVMKAPVHGVGPMTTLSSAARSMRFHAIGCLPVFAAGALLGIVTRGDLLKAGVPPEQACGEHRCASCGCHHAVAAHPCMEEICFCRECLESMGPSDVDDELGVGD